MKRKTLAALALLTASLTGCINGSYTEIKPDQSKVQFKFGSLLHKDVLKGLTVNSSTEKTKTGLKVQSAEGAGDPESIAALANLIGQASAAAAKAAMKP